jgi:hypothetical protein
MRIKTLNNKCPRKNHQLLIHFSPSRSRGNKKNQQKEIEKIVSWKMTWLTSINAAHDCTSHLYSRSPFFQHFTPFPPLTQATTPPQRSAARLPSPPFWLLSSNCFLLNYRKLESCSSSSFVRFSRQPVSSTQYNDEPTYSGRQLHSIFNRRCIITKYTAAGLLGRLSI